MKKHKIQQIIQKQCGSSQIIFDDGTRVFWPKNQMDGLTVGTRVYEHQHKNGQTVAFSWCNQLRFFGVQPLHFDAAVKFIEKFKWVDMISFNRAVINAMGYRSGPQLFPNTEKFAHNIVLFGVKQICRKSR